MNTFSVVIVIILSLLSINNFIMTASAIAQEGRIVEEVIYSPSIEGNLLGDSPNIAASVYLPAAYDQNKNECVQFPVIYLLHGYTQDNYSFAHSLEMTFNAFFSQENVQPMIIVIPNAHNTYRGSWYTNSYLTGNWEEFITEELVEYIDNNYKTIKSADSRGIAGFSMGGYGAIKLAMKHPTIYGAAGETYRNFLT